MSTGPSAPLRILLADDYDGIRLVLKQFLGTVPNCEVCGEATNGTDAVLKARELAPDLVILDISMPKQSGLEAARRIRQELPKAKIIIMSQHDPAQLLPSAREAGADACVDKSRTFADLLPTIVQLFS
jgi:DNA-binding NarL/FixJ family response regulator